MFSPRLNRAVPLKDVAYAMKRLAKVEAQRRRLLGLLHGYRRWVAM